MTEKNIQKPDFLPEKFWNSETQIPQLEALAKSYMALEKKMGQSYVLPKENLSEEDKVKVSKLLGHPETPEEYELTLPEHLEKDSEANKIMHAAGMTPQQVQVVYDLASQKLFPQLDDFKTLKASNDELHTLKNHFGSEKAIETISPQILKFAEKNFTPELADQLCSTAKGVIGLHEMMKAQSEPSLSSLESFSSEGLSDKSLRKMMSDPKYWRDQDADYVAKVKSGFKSLYGNK